jgi:hypothetical protein
MKPLARNEQITVEQVRGETLVYDLRNRKAHCLNAAVSAVWRACDGQTSIQGIAEHVRRELDRPLDEAFVETALAELSRAGLLETGPEEAGRVRSHLTRRQVSAGAAILLPLIATIAVPKPAAAASGAAPNPGGVPL